VAGISIAPPNRNSGTEYSSERGSENYQVPSNTIRFHGQQPLLTVRTGSEGICLDSQGGSVVHLSRYSHFFDLTKACINHSVKEIARLILETVGERVDIHGCD